MYFICYFKYYHFCEEITLWLKNIFLYHLITLISDYGLFFPSIVSFWLRKLTWQYIRLFIGVLSELPEQEAEHFVSYLLRGRAPFIQEGPHHFHFLLTFLGCKVTHPLHHLCGKRIIWCEMFIGDIALWYRQHRVFKMCETLFW